MSENKKCECPMCKQAFTPENGMTMEEHLAKGIIAIVREMQNNPDKHDPTCPRCGHARMKPILQRNALSRSADISVCDVCGTDEALRASENNALPLTEWYIVKEILKLREE